MNKEAKPIRRFRAQLNKLNAWAEGCIGRGDLDFDDRVYRTRNATRTLLDIMEGK